MKILALRRYLIKSCSGENVHNLELGPYGPKFDRMFMLVGRNGTMITQRVKPRMALIAPRTGLGGAIVVAPGMETLKLDFTRPLGERKEVRLHNQPPCVGFLYSREADEYFSTFLGAPCHLVRYAAKEPRVRDSSSCGKNFRVDGFADGHRLLVLSVGTYRDFAFRAPIDIETVRFRWNILTDGPNGSEDVPATYRTIRGGKLRLTWAKVCGRCNIPDVHPYRGEKDPHQRVWKTLQAHRPKDAEGNPTMGSNFNNSGNGTLHVGDALVPVP